MIFIDWRFDMSFKWLFGRPEVSSHLIQFLNDVVRETNPEVLDYITDDPTHFLNVERFFKEEETIKKIIYDLYLECNGENRAIIEMQKTSHPGWDIRMYHYLTKVLKEFRGVQHVLVAILDFKYHWKGTKLGEKVVKHYRVGNSGELITIELGRFNKSIAELESPLDKWLFLFKNSAKLIEIPATFKGTIFEKILNMSRVNTLPKEKLEDWQQELMDNKYIQGAIQMAAEEAAEEAFNEGLIEGRTKGLIEGRTKERKFLIQQLLNQGFTKQQIMELLDLDSDFPFES